MRKKVIFSLVAVGLIVAALGGTLLFQKLIQNNSTEVIVQKITGR